MYGAVACQPRKKDRVKSVVRMLSLMDLDDSSGVDLSEFQPFAQRNDGCLILSHMYCEQLRKVTFGRTFW